ncbi:MAG: toll/interleukin-1 receptor domain-containing protein [Planctomycetota bacterium]
MEREEAIELLRHGEQGIAEFNWRRSNGSVCPDLSFADLSNCNLHEVNLSKIELDGADLSESDLSSSSLVRAALRGANLRAAILNDAELNAAVMKRAVLTRADLNNASLVRADLRWADLRVADLRDADMRGVYLHLANLGDARLEGADLSSAICFDTVFGSCDMRSVTGLSSIIHEGPSVVGLAMLRECQGNLPEVFLRGCGLTETEIAYARSIALAESPIEFYSAFISYNHGDASFARRLHDALQGRGIRCWLDEHKIEAGDDIYSEVDRGLRVYDKVLLCASQNSLTSPWVLREVDTAVEREIALFKERGEQVLSLIPLNLDGHLFEWDGSHAAALRKRLAPNFTGWETDNAVFERELEDVVKALQLNSKEEPPEPKL